MRSKKLTVRFGLLAVLLVSLCLTSTSQALTIYYPRVATPEYSWVRTWQGAIIVYVSCDTPGATIKYTWNGSSERTYWLPLYVTRDAVLRAWATKPGWLPSRYVNRLTIDFPPYGNMS